MAITVSLQCVRKATTDHWDHFSTVSVHGDDPGRVSLFFDGLDHESKAIAVANAINGVTE